MAISAGQNRLEDAWVATKLLDCHAHFGSFCGAAT